MRRTRALAIAVAIVSVPVGALAQSSGGGSSGGGAASGASSGAAGTTSGGAAPSGRATGVPSSSGTTAPGAAVSPPPATGVPNPTAGSTTSGQSMTGSIPQAGRPDETRAIPDLRPGPTQGAPNQPGSAATGRSGQDDLPAGGGISGNTRSRIEGGGASGASSTSPAKRSMSDLEVCRSIWDPGTHITRQRWNELCERNRAENQMLNR